MVAEVAEGECEARGEASGLGDGAGAIGEERVHGARGFQVALGIRSEEAAGGVERSVMVETSEHVGDRAFGAGGVADAAGGEDGEMMGGGEVAEEGELAFLAAHAETLQFDVEPVGAEETQERSERGGGGGGTGGAPCATDGAVFVAGQGDEALGVGGDLGPGGVAGTFAVGGRRGGACGRARVEAGAGEELAEIFVAGAGGGEEREDAAVGEGELGADEGAHAGVAGGAEETRGAVDAIAVAEGEGGEFEPGSGGDERFRRGRAV